MSRTVAEPLDIEVADRQRHRWRMPFWPALGLAAGSGALLVLAFPRANFWPAAPIAVALLAVAVYRQRLRTGLLLGLAHGIVFFPILVFWVRIIGYDAWTALSIVEALYIAVLGATLALVSRLRWWPLWSAALWVAQEYARDHVPFGGFSWGRLAFGEAYGPYTQLTAVGGAPLVTFAVALTGALVAWAGLRLVDAPRRWRAPAVAVAAAGLVVSCGLAAPSGVPTKGSATVAVVQGNVPRLGLDFNAQREAVLRHHVNATHELARRVRAGKVAQPDLVVWPENSSDIDPIRDRSAGAFIDSAARDIHAPILVGAVLRAKDGVHLRNAGLVWSPKTGPGQRYYKRHLVPFGEYLPMRGLMTTLFGSRFAMLPRDMLPGHRPGRLHIGGVRVGAVMCYEVAYDDAMRDIAENTQLLAVQTNNATYGGTLQLDQQFAMSRMRAIEHGRPLVIAATSGISAIIEPDGTVLDRSKQFTRAEFVERLPLAAGATLADRVGPWLERAMLLLTVIGLALAGWRRVRGSGR